MKLNKDAYKQLIEEDIEWLKQFPDKLERRHIIEVLKSSPDFEYGPTAVEHGPLYILFDGPPGPEAGRFVEVEDADGDSVNAGPWTRRNSYWVLGPFYRK